LKHIQVDDCYDGSPLKAWVTAIARITLQVVTRPTAGQFTLIKRRWVIERRLARRQPGQPGASLRVYPIGGNREVEEWTVTAAPPSAGIDLVDVPLLKINDNHATGAAALPAAGQWRFQFTFRTPEIDQDSVTAQVPIK